MISIFAAAADLVKSLTARIAARKIPQKAKTSVKARLGKKKKRITGDSFFMIRCQYSYFRSFR